MIVYNTTFHIDKEILEDALVYLKRNYIPEAIADGVLVQPSLRRIMHATGEGENYAVQFYTTDMDTLKEWLGKEGNLIHRALAMHFGDKMSGFTTLMEVVDWTK
jgi:hypothetical protein